MKKILLCALAIVLLISIWSTGSATDLSLMDESSEVLALKQNLIKAGYLDNSEGTSSLFNKRTKEAIVSLQKDFGLVESGVATKEIQVIAQLLAMLEEKSASIQKVSEKPKIPDLRNMKKADASAALQALGLLPVVNEMFSDDVPSGQVVRTAPTYNQNFPADKRVNLFVSKGPKTIYSTNSTWYAWWVSGSKSDDYELYSPYIEDGYLYIELDATLNSSYKLKWRGYGTAAVRDTFDKVVPFELKYETQEITKGKTQRIVLVIPVKDLEVQKPTTLSVKIELYQNQKTERQLRMDFTMAWP